MRVEGSDVYYRFVFKHEELWRAVKGKYVGRGVKFKHSKREALGALHTMIAERLKRMGVEGGVSKIGKSGSAYCFYVIRPALEAFEG